MKTNKIAVVGAGILGLTTAYELLKKGHNVTIFEKDDRIGGMYASFDFDGLEVERYYHFFCKPDTPVFELLKELGIDHFLKWQKTKMGFFYEGNLYKWGNPVVLLRFPHLGLISKIRFSLQVMFSIKKNKWDKLDRLTAIQWIKGFVGEKAYNILWKSLLRLKFHSYKDSVSAAWVWRRLKRVGLSRKSVFTEILGYLEGGAGRLLGTLYQRITDLGGKVYLNAEIKKITITGKKVTGLKVNGKNRQFDRVITTIPLPYIPGIAPGLPEDLLEQYKKPDNIGVVCVILKLTNRLTENFWLNINDRTIELPGIIEFHNLNPGQEKIAYFPFYLPGTHKNFSKPDQYFIDEVLAYCGKINTAFEKRWVLRAKVHRYEYAQPICTPGFLDLLPPVKTKVDGLYIVDTSYYYPEDRSLSESIKMGKTMASMVASDS